MSKEEAMKLALEALEGMYIQGFTQDDSPINNAIIALREALTKPDFWEGYVPEPDKRQQALDRMAENARELGLDYEPVQQAPEHIVRSNGRYSPLLTHMMNERVKSNVKQVIHLYDEPPKQPAPATELPEQEPVARQYQNRDGVWKDFISEKHYKDTLEDGSWPIRNLYTSPPAQRTWVGLTDEERKLVRNSVGYNQFVTAGEYAEHVQKATEFKLREKNT